MKAKTKKKMPMFLYAIIMTVVFFVLTQGVIWGYGSDVIMESIMYAPQGRLVIGEAILAFLVLIVMLIFKNSYVFTEKGEKFLPSLKYGAFYIIFAGLFIIMNVGNFSRMPMGGLINLVLGCFLIGIAEEFLCRGWLLNEFLERYGSTKKGIWASIIISGIIFGVMHIGNYINGDELYGTITQILSAAATGILLGLIYYRTRNIWTTVFLHGLWDFSLFLNELVPVEELTPEISAGVVGIIVGVVLVVAELINLKPYLKNIDAKVKFGSIFKYALIAVAVFIGGMALEVFIMYSKIEEAETYKYENFVLEEYAITEDNYSEYYMKNIADNHDIGGVEYSFKLNLNDKGKLTLTNMFNKQFIEFEEEVMDFIIIDNLNEYILGYLYYDDASNEFLKYIFIPKEQLSNEYKFLESVKANIKQYLIKPHSRLYALSDYASNKSYLTAYSVDFGYFVLTEEGKMGILNRD